MKLTPKDRAVLRELFGGKCAYCGSSLPEKGWHADHVAPVNRQYRYARDKNNRTVLVPTGKLYAPGNDHADNLMPSCAPCNIDKSGMTLEDWRARLNRLGDNLRRNSSAFRHAERFGLASIAPGPVVFWFERAALEAQG